jgi:hypothetical protein
MAENKDRPPKRKLKRRPLTVAVTPAMKRWIEYGIADLEDAANGSSPKRSFRTDER